jgi:hypothetical protein
VEDEFKMKPSKAEEDIDYRKISDETETQDLIKKFFSGTKDIFNPGFERLSSIRLLKCCVDGIEIIVPYFQLTFSFSIIFTSK